MSYTLKDVDEAEKRIRAECPSALIARTNYDWSLSVAKPDRSAAFVVFDDREGGPTIASNVDEVIKLLKS